MTLSFEEARRKFESVDQFFRQLTQLIETKTNALNTLRSDFYNLKVLLNAATELLLKARQDLRKSREASQMQLEAGVDERIMPRLAKEFVAFWDYSFINKQITFDEINLYRETGFIGDQIDKLQPKQHPEHAKLIAKLHKANSKLLNLLKRLTMIGLKTLINQKNKNDKIDLTDPLLHSTKNKKIKHKIKVHHEVIYELINITPVEYPKLEWLEFTQQRVKELKSEFTKRSKEIKTLDSEVSQLEHDLNIVGQRLKLVTAEYKKTRRMEFNLLQQEQMQRITEAYRQGDFISEALEKQILNQLMYELMVKQTYYDLQDFVINALRKTGAPSHAIEAVKHDSKLKNELYKRARIDAINLTIELQNKLSFEGKGSAKINDENYKSINVSSFTSKKLKIEVAIEPKDCYVEPIDCSLDLKILKPKQLLWAHLPSNSIFIKTLVSKEPANISADNSPSYCKPKSTKSI